MTIADIRARQADGTFDCDGVQIRAHCRHLATVVTLRGEIGADNAARVGSHIRRFLLGENTVVLDMSGVSRFAGDGVSLLSDFDDSSRAAGLDWVLVASPAVLEALNSGTGAGRLPLTGSVHEALHGLADAIVNRRQQVLPLIGKTA